MNEKEIPSDLAKHDLTQNDNLPDWFCLIQTNRKYYIKRYREKQQGKNKIYTAAFALLFLGLLLSFYLFVFSDDDAYKYFESQKFIDNNMRLYYLFFFFCNVILTFFVIKMRNNNYFKQTKRNYEKRNRPDVYSGRSATLRKALLFFRFEYFFILLCLFLFLFSNFYGGGIISVFIILVVLFCRALFSIIFIPDAYSSMSIAIRNAYIFFKIGYFLILLSFFTFLFWGFSRQGSIPIYMTEFALFCWFLFSNVSIFAIQFVEKFKKDQMTLKRF
ncbi:MAG: hypothetical protein CNLJKLNK_01208 [Holosporales bacterium]